MAVIYIWPWVLHIVVITSPIVADESCDVTLTEPYGHITSPNYPSIYPINTVCTTDIHVQGSYNIIVYFQVFKIEPPDDSLRCYDKLQIVDVVAMTTEEYCGYKQPFNYTSQSNHIKLRLVSDVQVARPGYSATYHVLETEAPTLVNCPDNINAVVGQTVSWTAPTAVDNLDVNVIITSSHSPGTTFPIGNTIVTYTATDFANNRATCSFTVNVVDVELEVTTLPATSESHVVTMPTSSHHSHSTTNEESTIERQSSTSATIVTSDVTSTAYQTTLQTQKSTTTMESKESTTIATSAAALATTLTETTTEQPQIVSTSVDVPGTIGHSTTETQTVATSSDVSATGGQSTTQTQTIATSSDVSETAGQSTAQTQTVAKSSDVSETNSQSTTQSLATNNDASQTTGQSTTQIQITQAAYTTIMSSQSENTAKTKETHTESVQPAKRKDSDGQDLSVAWYYIFFGVSCFVFIVALIVMGVYFIWLDTIEQARLIAHYKKYWSKQK